MLATYKAILKGNTVIGADESPVMTSLEQEVEILVTVLWKRRVSVDDSQRGEKMARCLEKLANTSGIQGIADPVVWQRELRKDREIYPK